MTTESNGNVNEDQSQPKPYPINRPSFKVQDEFFEDDLKLKLVVDFRRLDSDNFRILLKKEEDTKRITETMTKNRTRDRLKVDEAHNTFFDSIALQGWITPEEGDEETLTYQDLKELNIEQKISFNVKYLDCKSIIKNIVGASKYDFLFDRGGHMISEFLIGDPEAPDFKLLLKFRRPKMSKRSRYREDFSYMVTTQGGDLPVAETRIDLRSGVNFFDENFETVIKDPNYSNVVFLKDDGTLDHEYVEGDDDDRKLLLKFLNPHFKVENSGSIVAKFSKKGREL